MPVLAFLGLPSLHGIIEAIANGFFGALAKALVPGWLTHGTVATIQHLVALPDPAEWPHLSALQGETTYLGAMLAPVTLSVATLRYWTMGLTGSAHPAGALGRCAGATGMLVIYRWGVEQVVAATNTLTHGLLALPAVSAGLSRIIGVLFGGALLGGVGGVFGALLVIVGVVLAAGLFAAQVLLTVVLAMLIVAGPPLIALAAIPELSHLAHAWRDALLSVALIPLAWTILFASAGALCLDATSFTGGAGGLPGHVAAAFAGLITFALAVKLPLMLLGELRHLLARGRLASHGTAGASPQMPGHERVRSSYARLRAVGLEGIPALGAAAGQAAGALGAPAGGPLGAARRMVARSSAGHPPTPGAPREREQVSQRGGRPERLRTRFAQARATLARGGREALQSARRPPTASHLSASDRSRPVAPVGERAATGKPPRAQRSVRMTVSREAPAAASGSVSGPPAAARRQGAARRTAPAGSGAPAQRSHAPVPSPLPAASSQTQLVPKLELAPEPLAARPLRPTPGAQGAAGERKAAPAPEPSPPRRERPASPPPPSPRRRPKGPKP